MRDLLNNSEKYASQKTYIDNIIDKAIALNSYSKKIIVFPEINNTILNACSIIQGKGIAVPLIIGKKSELMKLPDYNKITNINDEHIMDHLDEHNKEQFENYVKEFYDMRKADGKETDMNKIIESMSKPHMYGGMLVHKGVADGMISGIFSETKPYIPAFQIIKTRPDVVKASGLMIMQREDKVYFFADIALNINPTAEELSSIALTSAATARSLGVEPKVAMLSFSTYGSAKHEMVDKVKPATQIAKSKSPELILDGELQLDAAIVPEVAAKKCAGSTLEGKANVLIFPDLNAGNIGYKLTQRLAGYKAIGPIMQGLNKPINDLSRGASVDDVVELAAITVLQTR